MATSTYDPNEPPSIKRLVVDILIIFLGLCIATYVARQVYDRHQKTPADSSIINKVQLTNFNQ